MLFKDITIVDEDMQIREHMYVGVQDKHITYLSNQAPVDEKVFGRIYDGHGKLLTPGFFNAHSHSAMFLVRGFGENLPLSEWLTTKMFPFEEHLAADDVYIGTMLSAAEMLRFGIVGAADMYMHGRAIAKAFYDSGVKANVALGATCSDPAKEYKDTKYYVPTLELRDKYHGLDDDRIHIDFGLHAEYTSTEKLARSVSQAAREDGGSVHIHVSETAKEVAECRQRHGGLTPVAYFNECGLFDVPAIAAHCVHISMEDIAILRDKGVSVASCPKSNMKLASGFCPAANLLAAGVNIAVSTDSVASNNNLNMLEEAKTFALIHKGVTGDPTLITPAQALYSITRAGALAQGRPDCGLIKKGFRADLVVIDIDHIYMRPMYNLLTNLIYSSCGNDVLLTMVDGRILYEEGQFPNMDLPELLARGDASCRRIINAMKEKGTL